MGEGTPSLSGWVKHASPIGNALEKGFPQGLPNAMPLRSSISAGFVHRREDQGIPGGLNLSKLPLGPVGGDPPLLSWGCGWGA